MVLVLCPACFSVNVPDWVKQAAAQPLSAYPPDTDAVVLLDDNDVHIIGPGEYQEHYRRVVKILRPEGRSQGNFSVFLDANDKLVSVHCWSIDSGGREYEVKDKEFVEHGDYASYALYSDLRRKRAEAPGAGPGAVVAFEYEVHRREWLNQINWTLQEPSPVKDVRLEVTLPSGFEQKTSWAAIAPLQPTSIGANSWQWSAHDLPAIDDEPMMPAPYSLAGRMKLTYFPTSETSPNSSSWEGLARWVNGLTANRRTPSPEISAKVQELIAGKNTFDEKIRVLSTFLQTDIRYVAIEIGLGGYQPHTAGDIFRARYGDCKDKAVLLGSMLEQAGIHSEYLLINTERGVVDPASPANSFNHAILAIEIPADVKLENYHSVIAAKNGKHYIIFDPTDEYTAVGQLRPELQDSYALLVTESGGELIHTPVLPPDANTLCRDGHFTLTSDGELSGEVIETRGGNYASEERARLYDANEQERSQRLERRLNNWLKGFTLQGSKIEFLDQRQKNLVLTYKFASPQYAQVRGPLMLVRPRVLGEKSFEIPTRKPRQYSIELDGASRETDTYIIEIPPDYKVDDVPDPVKVDMGFATYESKFEVDGSKLRYWREYVVKDLRVPAEKLPELRKFEGIIGSDEMAAVVLKRAQ
ncbi:MAG TPA: DUF3857 domain-containing protein [Terriglobales bacterium]|jgi:transglutaminase-like putative cysteine protease